MKDKLLGILPVAIIIVVSLFTYLPIVHHFFQQDEWAVFADMTVFSNLSFLGKIEWLFRSSGIFSHFTPVTTLLSFFIFTTFRFNFPYYAIFNLTLHTFNMILVYIIMMKILGRNLWLPALSASLLFGIQKVSSQVVLWFAASLGAEVSTLFFLLSVLCFVEMFSKKHRFLLFFSVIFFALSFLSKETTISLAVCFPFISFFLLKAGTKKQKIYASVRYFQYYLVSIIVVFVTKFFLLILNPHEAPIDISSQSGGLFFLLLRVIYYPLIAFSQILDCCGVVFKNSHFFLLEEFPLLSKSPVADVINETLVPDILYLLLSFLLLLVTIYTFIRMLEKQKREAYILLGSVLLFSVSMLPYVPLPRFSSFLEARYYYTPAIFSGVWLSVLLTYWARRVFSRFAIYVYILVFGVIVFMNYSAIRAERDRLQAVSTVRKNILMQFRERFPTLTRKKTVFFVTGNGPDYLVRDLKVPFQSGFGNVLMIWYYDSGKIPAKALDGGFLYQLADQGYREIRGEGFGYYYAEESLKTTLMQGLFTIDDVYEAYYDIHTGKVIDLSSQLRKKLSESNGT
ncbi:MAG: hypothetical protein Q8Q49_03190 [bacterium]|nr:hypothetical protein [bacterium]